MLEPIALASEELEFKTPIEWEERREEFFLKRFFSAWKRVLTDPGRFFENLKRRGPYGKPFAFALIAEFLTLCAGSLLGGGIFAGFAVGGLGHWGVLGADFRIFSLLTGILLLVAGLFGAAFLYYAVSSLLGARGPYRTMFRMYGYTEGVVLFQLIPWAGILAAAVYRTVLLYFGFRKVYRFSSFRAALAAILPGLILCALMGLGGYSFYSDLVKF
jgi:hypothetical protein